MDGNRIVSRRMLNQYSDKALIALQEFSEKETQWL